MISLRDIRSWNPLGRARATAVNSARQLVGRVGRAENPAIPAMDAMPGWKRLYADKSAVVHVKTGA